MKLENKKVHKVILDTNIYISAFVFPGGKPEEILRLALNKEIRVFISYDILNEFIEVIRTKFKYSELVTKKFVQIIHSFSTSISPKERVDVIKEHKADNKILECALAARADYLVTGDRKHLLPLHKFYGTKIVSAEEFLRLI